MTAVGYDTAPDSDSSYYGSYFGYQAGRYSSSSADYSTHLGGLAGYYMTGGYNLAIGYKSGNDYSYGSYNILAGLNVNLASSSNTHSIVIGVGTTSTPFYGKGSYSTRIGDLSINDVWICGDSFYFGDETATGDKFWFFARSSSTSGHPGFKWNETDDQIEWSNDGSTWTPLGGGGGGTLDVVMGESTQADQLVYLDESMDSASPGVMAYRCSEGYLDYSSGITLEQAGWTAPTFPYAYDACALSSDTFLIAYQFGSNLRLRVVKHPFGGSATIGTPVDIVTDCAYISVAHLPTRQRTYLAGVVAYSDVTNTNGKIVPLTVSGTTITVGTPVNFDTALGIYGTAVGGFESGLETTGYGMLLWGSVNMGAGRAQTFSVSNLNTTPTLAMTGSAVSWLPFGDSMTVDKIGQPTLRTGTSGASTWSVMYGTEERRVRQGYVNGTTITMYEASREARVDGYDVYSGAPGYILDAAQYGTGDFFSLEGEGALLLSGTRTGFEGILYQVTVFGGPTRAVNMQGVPSHKTQVIGGGLASGPLAGATLDFLTLRTVGTNKCVVAAVSDNGSDPSFIMYGWGYLMGGSLRIFMEQPFWAGSPTYQPLLGAQPQHAAALFPITESSYGKVISYAYGGSTPYLRMWLSRIADPRLNFLGVMQGATANRGDTRTITLPGAEHTFTTLSTGATLAPGRTVYLDPSTSGFYSPGCQYRTLWSIGTATSTTKAIIKAPADYR